MKTTKMMTLIAAAGFLALAPVAGFAHGKPEHGGAFTEVREYTFEVVSKESEEAKDEKQPHTEKMSFTVYVKDPALKPVTSGSGSLKISEGKKQVAEASLNQSGDAFIANADLPHHGRYRVGIEFTPSGQKPIKANVTIKVD